MRFRRILLGFPAPILLAAFPSNAPAAPTPEQLALAANAAVLEEVQAAGKTLEIFVRDAKALLKEPLDQAVKREIAENQKTVQAQIDACLASVPEDRLAMDQIQILESAVCEAVALNSPDPCKSLKDFAPYEEKETKVAKPHPGQEHGARECRERFHAARLSRAVITADPGANDACAASCRNQEFTARDTADFCRLLLSGADPGPECARATKDSGDQPDWPAAGRTQECVEKVKLFRGALPCAATNFRNPVWKAACLSTERFRAAFKTKNGGACGEDQVCRAMFHPDSKACDYVKKKKAAYCENTSTRLQGEARDKRAKLLSNPTDPALAMNRVVSSMLPHIRTALTGAEGLPLGPKDQEAVEILRQSVLGKKGALSRSSLLAVIMRVHENNFRARVARLDSILKDYQPAFEAQALQKKLFDARQRAESAIKDFWAAPEAKASAPK